MANLPSRNREMNSSNGKGPHRGNPMNAETVTGLSTRQLLQDDDGWGDPSDTPTDLKALSSEENQQMLAAARSTDRGQGGSPGKLEQLRAENEEMRALIGDLRKQVDAAVGHTQEAFAKREEEFEALLEEKSEELRTLFMRIQGQEQKKATDAAEYGASAAGREDEERASMWEDIQREHAGLEEERQRLKEERQQVRDDEEEMMQRMRDMELQVAKSRTELVRHRNELQQLHNEVRSELEKAQQTGAGVERLRSLRQQHQEVSKSRR